MPAVAVGKVARLAILTRGGQNSIRTLSVLFIPSREKLPHLLAQNGANVERNMPVRLIQKTRCVRSCSPCLLRFPTRPPSLCEPEVFFLTSVSFEIWAELIFLSIGFCWLRRHSNLRTSVKTLTKDPVHHIAAVATDSADDISWEFSALSLATIVLSLVPLLAWSTFFPLWGPSFADAGDQSARTALSACSIVGVGTFVTSGARARVASSGVDRQRAMDVLVAVGMVLYAGQKCFEVYFLLSNIERLCPHTIGKALIAFLCFEVVSVAIVVVALITVARPMPSCAGDKRNLQNA